MGLFPYQYGLHTFDAPLNLTALAAFAAWAVLIGGDSILSCNLVAYVVSLKNENCA